VALPLEFIDQVIVNKYRWTKSLVHTWSATIQADHSRLLGIANQNSLAQPKADFDDTVVFILPVQKNLFTFSAVSLKERRNSVEPVLEWFFKRRKRCVFF